MTSVHRIIEHFDLDLAAESVESITFEIETTGDPVASPPTFAFAAEGSPVTAPAVAAFTEAGSWSADGFDSAVNRIEATSAPIGSAPFTMTSGTVYRLWVRWTVGSENPIREVARILAI